ncbi:hypothetical protein ES708_17696 [subsurface metagenome]
MKDHLKIPVHQTILFCLAIIVACNNPFATRKPQGGGSFTGVAIKPANSAENVLYNLRASFENLSAQDYIYIFSEDFTFSPDPEDSLAFIEEFRTGWDYNRELLFGK